MGDVQVSDPDKDLFQVDHSQPLKNKVFFKKDDFYHVRQVPKDPETQSQDAIKIAQIF